MNGTMVRRLGAVAAAAMVLAGCGGHPVAVTPVKSAAVKAKASEDASRALMISYITCNGQMGTSFTVKQGQPVWLRAQVWDTENLRVQYDWSGFGVMGGFSDQAQFMTSMPGSFTVNLNVRDEKGNSDWRWITINVVKAGTVIEPTR